jgi:hypothetical protein
LLASLGCRPDTNVLEVNTHNFVAGDANLDKVASDGGLALSI